MKSVKFIKPWSMYSPGDVAGFEEGRAAAIIKTGAAEPHEVSGGEPAVEVPLQDPAAEPAGDEPKPAGRKAK